MGPRRRGTQRRGALKAEGRGIARQRRADSRRPGSRAAIGPRGASPACTERSEGKRDTEPEGAALALEREVRR